MILFICLSLCIAGQAAAQRYFPGQQGLQLTAGLADGFSFSRCEGSAFHVALALSAYNKYRNRWVFGGEYLEKQFAYRETLLPVQQVTGEGGFYFPFLSDTRKNVFFSAGGSALAGYEILNRSHSLLYDGATLTGKDGFIYGGAVALEIEAFLTDRIIFLLNAREKAVFNSAINRFHFQVGCGIKLIIN